MSPFLLTMGGADEGGILVACRIAVMSVAYKPGTVDVRDSASLAVSDRLAGEGAAVVVHDPVALDSAAAEKVLACGARSRIWEAVGDAELVSHLTEWDEYRIDPVELAAVAARRNTIDARSAADERLWRGAGQCFRAIGRR
jgi:UDPglucose 6-dehydrogenase